MKKHFINLFCFYGVHVVFVYLLGPQIQPIVHSQLSAATKSMALSFLNPSVPFYYILLTATALPSGHSTSLAQSEGVESCGPVQGLCGVSRWAQERRG